LQTIERANTPVGRRKVPKPLRLKGTIRVNAPLGRDDGLSCLRTRGAISLILSCGYEWGRGRIRAMAIAH
jgi:hypothetical protein